jgi:phage gpG-like protein
MQIDFMVEGDVEVISMFELSAARSKNLRTPFRKIAKMLLDVIDQNFEGRGKIWGKWKRRLRAPDDGHPLLEDTGEMRNNFDDKVSSNSATIGNRSDHFKFHQSKKPRKTRLARRVMMAIEDDQRRDSMKILQEYVMEGK